MNFLPDDDNTLNFLDLIELKAAQDNISIEVKWPEDIHEGENNRITELEKEFIEQKELTNQLELSKETATKEISELKSKKESKLKIQREKFEETHEKWKGEIIKEQLKISQEMGNIEIRIQKMAENAQKEAIRAAAIREEKIHQELETETRQKNEWELQLVIQKLEEETNSQKDSIQQQQQEINELTKQVENEKSLCAKMESDHKNILELIENQRLKRACGSRRKQEQKNSPKRNFVHTAKKSSRKWKKLLTNVFYYLFIFMLKIVVFLKFLWTIFQL